MSMGYFACCRKIAEDENRVEFEYACCDIATDDWEQAKETYDGKIIVDKDAFVEPEIREKLKRMPSGRKKIVIKRIRNDVDFKKLIRYRKIVIKNCRGTWKTRDDIDIMAIRLVWKMFGEYQDLGKIPEKVIWCS